MSTIKFFVRGQLRIYKERILICERQFPLRVELQCHFKGLELKILCVMQERYMGWLKGQFKNSHEFLQIRKASFVRDFIPSPTQFRFQFKILRPFMEFFTLQERSMDLTFRSLYLQSEERIIIVKNNFIQFHCKVQQI